MNWSVEGFNVCECGVGVRGPSVGKEEQKAETETERQFGVISIWVGRVFAERMEMRVRKIEQGGEQRLADAMRGR